MGDSREKETLPAALACVRRLVWGWTFNRTRNAWWRYSKGDEMNVRHLIYEAAGEGEREVMEAAFSDSSASPDA